MKISAGTVVSALAISTWQSCHLVSGFSTPSLPSSMKRCSVEQSTRLWSTTDEDTAAATAADDSTEADSKAVTTTTTAELFIPLSFDEMVRQVSSAMEDAYKNGISRQTIRILLPRSTDNDQLLVYVENDAEKVASTENIVLVPPDETWQGGIMQLYRAASFSCQEILRRYSRNAAGGVVPRLQEDRSVDESGVDGIGLWMTQGASPQDDVSCFVQPSQETIDAVESISSQAGDRLVTLINPQWRIQDDALDNASRQEGVLGNLASFLGGKGGSLRRLDAMGFESTFILEGYVCRGGNVRLVKRFDSDWVVFAENDAATDFVRIGTSTTRPTYQDIDAMLEEKGIGLKYARDIGLSPKI